MYHVWIRSNDIATIVFLCTFIWRKIMGLISLGQNVHFINGQWTKKHNELCTIISQCRYIYKDDTIIYTTNLTVTFIQQFHFNKQQIKIILASTSWGDVHNVYNIVRVDISTNKTMGFWNLHINTSQILKSIYFNRYYKYVIIDLPLL